MELSVQEYQYLVSEITRETGAKRDGSGKNLIVPRCPFCGKQGGKFGIYIGKETVRHRPFMAHCFSCGASTRTLAQLLAAIGRMDLMVSETTDISAPLNLHLLEPDEAEDIDDELVPSGLPDFYKRTFRHPYLKQRGIAALDAVVVTHPDADHTNGILELLELIGEQKTALRIRHLFLPVWMKGSEKENPFILAAQKAGIMVEYLKKGDEIRAGELTVSVLHPGAGEDYTGEENAGSVVLQLSCGACRALLTGDLEGSGEEEVLGAAERCQILKVAHHGSKNSTSEAFLNRIQPQISLISCAWPGRYGHPHRELLERLRACKSHIYGTPVDGAVTVQLKRDRLAVHGYRSDVEFPVS